MPGHGFIISEDHTDISSSESSSISEDQMINGIKCITLTEKPTNGVAQTETKADDNTTEDDDEPDERYEPGMKLGMKELYSGKEDKRGRYQWQDTMPTDLGDPAENDKTAKWALLVRNVKVYGDPRKVLAIHSIVVQSPLLKNLLAGVLKDYPGVTVGLQRLEFSGRFEPLIHRWPELQEAITALGDKTEDEKITKAHAELLQGVLRREFKTVIDTSQDLMSKRVMTYDHLWTFFHPGAVMYTRSDGQECAYILSNTKYGVGSKGVPCFWLTCKYVDWDGVKFGMQAINVSIPIYEGTRPITQLRAYPIHYHPELSALKARLIERGGKAEGLAGANYRAYSGIGWRMGAFGTKDKHNIKGRIIIDTYGWNRFNSSDAIYVTPMKAKHSTEHSGLSNDEDLDQDSDSSDDEDPEHDIDDSGMPLDGHFADEDENKRMPLTKKEKLICTPLLRGYSLKTKLWLNFFVNCVEDIKWHTNAFDRLVLPKNQKELVLGFTESQRKYRDTFDDVIEGKGRGMIVLLCGPPGVGKTLTAESVAEEMRVPLYMMSAGDLGLDPRHIEQNLQDILEMCARWNAVCLLDEADVFLEQRSLHELERNKLVTIFLRILEYYEGTMFLTTNRVNTFDPAFQSRIHISLDYPELSMSSKKRVWKNFLDSFPEKHKITDDQLDGLARMSLNGRQIKNILKIARLLATRKDEELNHEHIVTTLEVTQHLHNETQFSERSRGSLYH